VPVSNRRWVLELTMTDWQLIPKRCPYFLTKLNVVRRSIASVELWFNHLRRGQASRREAVAHQVVYDVGKRRA